MIQVENLCKKLGRFDALRGLSFEVPEGGAFAMIGANGAGKTTMIKVLMNILEPSRGSACRSSAKSKTPAGRQRRENRRASGDSGCAASPGRAARFARPA
jgi:ABC-type multidrug transport system ATPase subunit